MQRLYLFLFLLLFIGLKGYSQIKFGDSETIADSNAIMEVSSTTQGMLIPRLTTSQRNAMSQPKGPIMIYNSDKKELEYNNDGIWHNIAVRDTTNFSNYLKKAEWDSKLPNFTTYPKRYKVVGKAGFGQNSGVLNFVSTRTFSKENPTLVPLQFLLPDAFVGTKNLIRFGKSTSANSSIMMGYFASEQNYITTPPRFSKFHRFVLGLDYDQNAIQLASVPGGIDQYPSQLDYYVGSELKGRVEVTEHLFLNLLESGTKSGTVNVIGNKRLNSITVNGNCINCFNPNLLSTDGARTVFFNEGYGTLNLPNGITYDPSKEIILLSSNCGAIIAKNGNSGNNTTIPLTAMILSNGEVRPYSGVDPCSVNFNIINHY